MPKTIKIRQEDGTVLTVTASDEALAHLRRESRNRLRELAGQIDPDPQQDLEEFDRKIRKELKARGLEMSAYGDVAQEIFAEWGTRHAAREARFSAADAPPGPTDAEIRRVLDERGLDMSSYADVAVELASGKTAGSGAGGTVELAGFAGMGRTNYAPREWVKACVVHLEPTYKEPIDTTKHSLPVRKPNGELSLEAMKEAEKRLLASDGLAPEVQRQAARELVGVYRLVNDNPSDALKALAGVNYYGLSEDGDTEDGDRTIPVVDGAHGFTSEEARELAEAENISYADAAVRLAERRGR